MPRERVALDPETNVVVGIESALNHFYERHKTTGFFRQGAITVNQSAPQSGDGVKLDLSKMSQKDKLEYLRKLHNKK
jgi:hypothetical protein